MPCAWFCQGPSLLPTGISCLGVSHVWTHIMTGLNGSYISGTEFRSSCSMQMACLMDAKLDRSLSLVLGKFRPSNANTGVCGCRAVEAISMTSMLLCQLLFQIQSVYQGAFVCFNSTSAAVATETQSFTSPGRTSALCYLDRLQVFLKSALHKSPAWTVEILTCLRYWGDFYSFK